MHSLHWQMDEQCKVDKQSRGPWFDKTPPSDVQQPVLTMLGEGWICCAFDLDSDWSTWDLPWAWLMTYLWRLLCISKEHALCGQTSAVSSVLLFSLKTDKVPATVGYQHRGLYSISQKLRWTAIEHFVLFLEYLMAFSCLYSILSDFFCLSLNNSDLHKEDLDEEANILTPRLDSNGIQLQL